MQNRCLNDPDWQPLPYGQSAAGSIWDGGLSVWDGGLSIWDANQTPGTPLWVPQCWD